MTPTDLKLEILTLIHEHSDPHTHVTISTLFTHFNGKLNLSSEESSRLKRAVANNVNRLVKDGWIRFVPDVSEQTRVHKTYIPLYPRLKNKGNGKKDE